MTNLSEEGMRIFGMLPVARFAAASGLIGAPTSAVAELQALRAKLAEAEAALRGSRAEVAALNTALAQQERPEEKAAPATAPIFRAIARMTRINEFRTPVINW